MGGTTKLGLTRIEAELQSPVGPKWLTRVDSRTFPVDWWLPKVMGPQTPVEPGFKYVLLTGGAPKVTGPHQNGTPPYWSIKGSIVIQGSRWSLPSRDKGTLFKGLKGHPPQGHGRLLGVQR